MEAIDLSDSEIKRQKRVLIFENRRDYLNLYALNLIVYTDVEIVIKTDLRELLAEFEEQTPDVVIVNAHDPKDRNIGVDIHRILKREKVKPSVLIIGGEESPAEYITVAPSNFALQKVVKFVAQKMGITAKDMAAKATKEFWPLPVKYLLPGWQATRNVYPSSLGDNEPPFLISGEIFTQDLINKLKITNVKNVYVRSKFRVEMVNTFTSYMQETLDDKSLILKCRNIETSLGYKMIMEQIQNIGVTESNINLTKSVINSIQKVVQEVPSLDALLDELFGDVDGERYKHSVLIAYIGNQMCEKLKWATQEQKDLLTYTAFFHDICLKEDKLLKYNSDSMIYESTELSSKERNLLLNHAKISAKLVSEIPQLPFGLDNVIKQHHGSNMGDSLSKISNSVSNIAIVFIFAEEFVKIIMDKEKKKMYKSSKDVVNYLQKVYHVQKYQEFLHVLHDLKLSWK